MKKALFIKNTFKADDSNYNRNEQIYINILKELGYKIHIISNDLVNSYTDYIKVEFSRNLFSLKNLKAYKKLKYLINKNNYEIIQCSNFITGVLTRLANKKQNKKLIYSIDSFAFFRKQFFIKKIFYYLTEKYLSKYTDTIIVGNKEDYVISKSKFHAKHVKLIKILNKEYKKKTKESNTLQENTKELNIIKSTPKVINFKEYNIVKNIIKEEYGFKDDDYIFLNISNLCSKENHIMQLEAMIDVIKKYPQAKLLIIGDGKQREYLDNIILKYGLNKNVIILDDNFCNNNVNKLDYIDICDCYLSTTTKKGDISNIIIAMEERKPILASNIKEYRDILKNKNLFEVKDIKTLKYKMIKNIEKSIKFEKYYNIEKYKIEKEIEKICKIYIN